MKELIQLWISRPAERMTEEEIEVRTWSFVVRSITIMAVSYTHLTLPTIYSV